MAKNNGNLQKHLNSNPLQRLLINRFHARVLRWVDFLRPVTILDAGCGEGFVLDRLRGGFGVDISAPALAYARQRLDDPVNQANLYNLPFADNSFDLVVCLEVLEHLPEPGHGLAELLRVARWFVLVSVPHEPWFRTANFLRGKHLAALGNDPEHLQNFTGPEFRRFVGCFPGKLLWHGYSFPWQLAVIGKRVDPIARNGEGRRRTSPSVTWPPGYIATNGGGAAPPETTILKEEQ